MLTSIIDLLQCPACHGPLDWQIERQEGERIETAQARCAQCQALYPVKGGIGLFLTPGLAREDLWEELESGLSGYLRENPDREQRLLGASLDALSPADLFFRALVLEERGALDQARRLFTIAQPGLYTPEYLICQESQYHYVIDRLADGDGPVVDLASGRGDLVFHLARELTRPVIATDISPRVLRMDRRRLEAEGLFARVSLLAMDARRTPFRDGAVHTMTSNLGLANIRAAENLLGELRRVISGELLAIMHFFPASDEANAQAIQRLDLPPLLFKESALDLFESAAWQAGVENSCAGRALPTPSSQVIPGLGVDSLPVAETTLEWGVLAASPAAGAGT